MKLKMKSKQAAALICAAAMILAGCGTEGGTGSTANASGTVGAERAYREIEEAGDITITLMMSGTETENDFDTKILPVLIKEKWPNVTLEVTKLPDDNYYTALKTKLASGECPDMILVQPMYAGSNACYSLADAGYLTPLNEMECLTNMEDVSGMTYQDNVYAIPKGISILGTYYNKDIFEESGITEVPQDWDEFLRVCETIKNAGHQPIVMGDKDQYVLQFGLYQLAANEIYSVNPDYDMQLRTGETSFTDEGTWDQVLSMYNELYAKGYIDASQTLGLSASQAIQEFIDGNAAMTFDGSFNVTALLANGAAGDFERGYFPLPGSKGDVSAAAALSAGLGIYSGSKYIDECKEILNYWFDGESEIWDQYIASGKFVMTYGNGADTAPNYELFQPFIDLMNEGRGYHWCNQAWPAGTETAMQELFSEMIGGQGTTVADITQGMQYKFDDLLED